MKGYAICPATAKDMFLTEREARNGARTGHLTTASTYRCAHCDAWHWSSQPFSRRRRAFDRQTSRRRRAS